MSIETQKFPLGQLVTTRNAMDSLTPADIVTGVNRHASGDWGDVCKEDEGLNDQALINGTRLLSVYHALNGTKFWIITEWDRSVTTVLLPEDY